MLSLQSLIFQQVVQQQGLRQPTATPQYFSSQVGCRWKSQFSLVWTSQFIKAFAPFLAFTEVADWENYLSPNCCNTDSFTQSDRLVETETSASSFWKLLWHEVNPPTDLGVWPRSSEWQDQCLRKWALRLIQCAMIEDARFCSRRQLPNSFFGTWQHNFLWYLCENFVEVYLTLKYLHGWTQASWLQNFFFRKRTMQPIRRHKHNIRGENCCFLSKHCLQLTSLSQPEKHEMGIKIIETNKVDCVSVRSVIDFKRKP